MTAAGGRRSFGARAGAARAISALVGAVVLVLVAWILLVVLEANPANDIVTVVGDVANFLVGPFEQLFTLDDRKAQVAVNYGVAALVYLVIGRILAGIVAP